MLQFLRTSSRPAPPLASHSDAWSGRPSRLRTGAPRQTSSTRRSRRTCPATWAAARRIPGTRRPVWPASFQQLSPKHRITETQKTFIFSSSLEKVFFRVSVLPCFCECFLVVLALHTRAKSTQDLVRDRADPRRHFARVDDLAGLRSEKHDFVSG